MDERITKQYITLSLLRGLGPVSQNRLLKLCGGIDGVFQSDLEELLRLDALSDPKHRIGEKRLKDFVRSRDAVNPESAGEPSVSDAGSEDDPGQPHAEKLLERCEKLGITVITAGDPAYPARFKGLPDMPIVLYTKGNLRINEFPRSAGIVGARRCTAEDKQAAIEKTKAETALGAAIISGMAKGIDSYAHTAALKSGGYTIAVLGSGPDLCYPKEHEPLYEKIIKNGCILSEYLPGTTPRAYMFPKRNRLIAALSDELYVIGAGRNSGTETTMAAWRKYGRNKCVDG